MQTDNYLKKELYELIKKDESIFDFIQESSLDGMWYWDLENPENEWMNPKFWTVLGYNPDEMPHKTSAWQDIINRDDLKTAIENFTKHCENPSHPYDQIVRYTHKNGSIIWMRCRGLAIRDKDGKPIRMLGAHHDITEIKNTQHDLIEIEKKSSIWLENSPICTKIVDLNFNLQYMSQSGVKELKIDDINQFYGKPYPFYFYPDSFKIPMTKNLHEAKETGRIITQEASVVDTKGDILWYHSTIVPVFNNNNEVDYIMVVSMETTKRKEVELELIKAKEKAEENDRLKTAFLQNMSHEIRTPLNSIIGFSERINSPKISDEKRQFYTDIIVKSGFQLLSIVSDILTISAIDTGQEELNKENVCINSLISDIETVFKQQLEGKMVTLKVTKPLPNVDTEIITDKAKLTQILTNLISNAMKFTPVGVIEYGYTLKNSELEFFVKDNGIGIHKSKHKIIFDRFVQAEDNIHFDYGGTGLGLSICKGFVELLGGKIWVESELEKGATFYFTIPYKPSRIEKCDEILLTKQEEIKQNENKTVLVAEDQIFNYIYLEEHLKELNYKVIHAKNGKEAVEICRTNESIDIVLMDIRMPIMDGHQAAMLIKEFRPNLKIVAQTAYAINVEIEKYGKAFDDYLTKPLTSEKLSNILNRQLNPDK